MDEQECGRLGSTMMETPRKEVKDRGREKLRGKTRGQCSPQLPRVQQRHIARPKGRGARTLCPGTKQSWLPWEHKEQMGKFSPGQSP